MYNPSKCVSCGAKLNPGALFCTKCGTHVPVSEGNYCTNPNCSRHKNNYEFAPDDLYCDTCGKPTTLGIEVNKLT